MKRTLTLTSTTPVIAAAARRRARNFRVEKKGQKTPNNYLAEIGLSHGNRSQNAKGAGAPSGNRNALKHGLHSGKRRAFRRHCKELVRDTYALIAAMKAHYPMGRP